MQDPWATSDLSEAADEWSPAGETEIRLLPSSPAGGFAHARLAGGKTSKPAILSEITEMFYVLQGDGEIWRKSESFEQVADLRKGRCVSIPPGVSFQYRSGNQGLYFIVAAMPQWHAAVWHESPLGHWDTEGSQPPDPHLAVGAPWSLQDLRYYADDLAPDGSEIRQLLAVPAGSLVHCSLRPGATSMAVRHRTVEEIWFVLAGAGEIWRSANGRAEVSELRPGRGVTIPRETGFQFRCTSDGPLQILIGTFPRWPGASEAELVTGGWT